MTHHTGTAWAVYDALFSDAPLPQRSPTRPAAVPPVVFQTPHPGGSRDNAPNERNAR